MTSIYPAQYLVIPLYAQERLPPAFQNVDLEILMVYHSVIGLIGSNFWVHEPWLFPLSLFGLIACCSSSQQLLSHFLAFWIASIPLDIVWLLYRSDQARSIMIFLMGINMCCKLVSGAQIARSLQTQGVIPDISSSTWGTSASSQQPWLNGGSTAPFGLPGSWSGQQGPYRDTEANPQPYQQSQQQPQRTNPTSAPPYRSIYDEEANEDDAPQVRVENVANSVAAAAAAAAAKGSQNKEYNSTSNNR